ncbi:MAG: hypothetical protein J7L04_01995 [Bacteroidales bacterium]|nr:hypothetical protein [Bacteroidales bacterium]
MNRKAHKFSRPEARAENIRLAKVESSKPGSQRDRFSGSRTKAKARITVIWHQLEPTGEKR